MLTLVVATTYLFVVCALILRDDFQIKLQFLLCENRLTPWDKFALGNCQALGGNGLSRYEIKHKLIKSGGGRGI